MIPQWCHAGEGRPRRKHFAGVVAAFAALLVGGSEPRAAETRMAGSDPPVHAGEAIDSLAEARAFLARQPTGPVAREVRRREYWFRVGRRVIEDGEVTRAVRFVYDAAGNRVRRTWQDGDWSEMTHDARGRLLRERFHEGDGTVFGRALHDYDERGRRVRERYFSQGRDRPDLDIRYDYGRAGQRAREVTVRRDGSRTIEIHARDPAGRLHFTRSRTLDEDGAVTATGRVTFVYGPDGHRTHRFERRRGEDGPFEARTRYVHDHSGRLIRRLDRRTANGGWIEQERVYEYDAAGNRVVERVRNAAGAALRIEYDYRRRPVDFSGYIDAVR